MIGHLPGIGRFLGAVACGIAGGIVAAGVLVLVWIVSAVPSAGN